MKFMDIAFAGFEVAWSQLAQYRGFSEDEKTKIRGYARKLKPYKDDFSTRYGELQKEYKDDEFKSKEAELLQVEIDLVPELSYEVVKKVSLSLVDDAFLQPHICDLPEEMK